MVSVRCALWCTLCQNGAMSMLRYIADMESQFDQERRHELWQDLNELVVEERASVTLVQRIQARKGHELTLLLRGASRVNGMLMEVAHTWVLLRNDREELLIPLDAVMEASPLSWAMPEVNHVASKLSMASILRRLAEENVSLCIEHDAGQIRGTIHAVYADHMDVRKEPDFCEDARDYCAGELVSISMRGVQKISVIAHGW